MKVETRNLKDSKIKKGGVTVYYRNKIEEVNNFKRRGNPLTCNRDRGTI